MVNETKPTKMRRSAQMHRETWIHFERSRRRNLKILKKHVIDEERSVSRLLSEADSMPFKGMCDHESLFVRFIFSYQELTGNILGKLNCFI